MRFEVPFPEHPANSCINCGFLSRRGVNAGHLGGEHFEAVPEARRHGNVGRVYEGMEAWCFRRAADLREEIGPLGTMEERLFDYPDRELPVTTKARDCPQFTPYIEGHSPLNTWTSYA